MHPRLVFHRDHDTQDRPAAGTYFLTVSIFPLPPRRSPRRTSILTFVFVLGSTWGEIDS
jgi:hypothetical protein